MVTGRALRWGVVLIVVGLAGLVLVWLIGPSGSPLVPEGAFSSDGERIFYTGIGDDGRAIPRTIAGSAMMGPGMMGGISCVGCHGEDGRGGTIRMMARSINVPDIRYSALTAPHQEDDETRPAWTDREIARAIREGIEPDGTRLKAPMPRWDMTDAEVRAVIAYLKELD